VTGVDLAAGPRVERRLEHAAPPESAEPVAELLLVPEPVALALLVLAGLLVLRNEGILSRDTSPVVVPDEP
jgi:hypothetical protein